MRQTLDYLPWFITQMLVLSAIAAVAAGCSTPTPVQVGPDRWAATDQQPVC